MVMTRSRNSRGSVLGVIPARYKSSRYEGKPLVSISGVPMIKRTYLQARKSTLLDDVVVATDDKRIEDYCYSEDIPVCMTSSSCLTGTDRVYEVSLQRDYELYVNIQGDEPVIDPASIDQILSLYHQHGSTYAAYNLYKYISDDSMVNSTTIIKVITNEMDEVMYMSRLPVPFSQSSSSVDFKQQVPVYGYTKQALEVFSGRSKTLNEKHEDIELLRFVDMGLKIKMAPTTVSSISVDVPSDVLKVEEFLRRNSLP